MYTSLFHLFQPPIKLIDTLINNKKLIAGHIDQVYCSDYFELKKLTSYIMLKIQR